MKYKFEYPSLILKKTLGPSWIIFIYKNIYKIRIRKLYDKIIFDINYNSNIIKSEVYDYENHHFSYYIRIAILDCIKHEREVNEI